jgi:tight adherence protein C
MKKYAAVAGTLVLSYKAPDLWLSNSTKAPRCPQRPSHAPCSSSAPEAGPLPAGRASLFSRCAKELGKAYPELGDEFGPTAIEPSSTPQRV